MNHHSKTREKVTSLSKLSAYTGHKVILANCYCHTFDEVVAQIVKAVGCSSNTASQYADTAEKFSSVAVYTGSYSKCIEVAKILGSTGLEVELD